jgi:hypothetical protein
MESGAVTFVAIYLSNYYHRYFVGANGKGLVIVSPSTDLTLLLSITIGKSFPID